MQSAVYSAVFGSTTQSKRLDYIANNLANVNTTGYKRMAMSFCDAFRNQEIGKAPMVSETRLHTVDVDLTQGGLTMTGNPLDLAIEGRGFFKLETPNGVRYTRAGMFRLDANGVITDAHGNILQGEGGPVTVPRDAQPVINDAGDVYVDGAVVGRIAMVTFDAPQDLEPVGHHLFRTPDDQAFEEIPATDATLHQGFLENSNVEVVQEMVRMIEVSRNVGAEQKIMTTSSDMDDKAINTVGDI